MPSGIKDNVLYPDADMDVNFNNPVAMVIPSQKT